MRSRGVRFGVVPVFNSWVEVRTPEELEDAVRQKLLDAAAGQPAN